MKAIKLFQQAEAKDRDEYYQQHAQIARALLSIDSETEANLKRKLDIAYYLSKENIPFTKMSSLHSFEERNKLNLDSGYKNNLACAVFLECIAQDIREQLFSVLGNVQFFSIQADGSMDCSKFI